MIKNDEQETSVLATLQLELRRGAMVLAVLSQLKEAEYGYSLKQQLSEAGLEIPEGTLYPLLRRLEAQGLLESEWRVVDEKRPRRYYKISQEGQQVFAALSREWRDLQEAVNNLLHTVAAGKNGEENG
ncbi:MAG: PadR family transcriptional regulator [Caldilineaceae bacterium]|nr:PadR family transcriptional regulator [Caldilineaceae bacterium]